MIRVSSIARLCAVSSCALTLGLAPPVHAAPRERSKQSIVVVAPEVDVDVSACGAAAPAGARWFYLGAPGDRGAEGVAARRALRALREAWGTRFSHDPACLHVEILDDGALEQRYKRFGKKGPPSQIVGFHNPKLGADSTVFVVPQPGQGLDVVILHEVLHALSHRFSLEAGRKRLNHLVEGATEYLTRALAEASLGIPKRAFRTGYGSYVAFYDALMARLGSDGLGQLGAAYLGDGYDAYEREVDTRLSTSLRAAGRALESDDLRSAVQRLSAGADEARDGAGTETRRGGL